MLNSRFLNKISRFFNAGKAAPAPEDIAVDEVAVNKKTVKSFTVGVFYPDKAIFMVKNPHSEHSHRLFEFAYPAEHWLPLTGDWEGSGVMGCALYDPNTSLFILRNKDDSGYPDKTVFFGSAGAGWLPIAGDWDGDGRDSVGLYNPKTSQFYLNNTGKGGAPDCQFSFGTANQGGLPIAGDWNGDGVDGVGLYYPDQGVFYLRNALTSGEADHIFHYGKVASGTLPVVGDWDADGCDGIGLYNPDTGLFELRNSLVAGSSDTQLTFGLSHLKGIPIALPWSEWRLSDIQSDKNIADRLGSNRSAEPQSAEGEHQQLPEETERSRLGLRMINPPTETETAVNETELLRKK